MPESTAALMYVLFAASLAVLVFGFWFRFRLYRRGGHEVVWDHPLERLTNLVRIGLLQAKTAKKKYAGPMHQMIYWGFLALFIGTLLVLVEYDFTLPVFDYQFLVGNFYLLFELVLDAMGLVFLGGLFLAIQRRRSPSAEAFTRKPQDVWILGSLFLLGVQGFLVEGLRIAIRQPSWGAFSFVGFSLAQAFSLLPPVKLLALYRFAWWFHTVSVFVWIATIPFTKMQHILMAPANIFFSTPKARQAKGELNKPFDLKQALETGALDLKLGAQRLEDFTWRQLLMLDSCTECGRCTDACPAHAAGRPLSPMQVVLDLQAELHRRANDDAGAALTFEGPAPDTPQETVPEPEPPPSGNQLVEGVIRSSTLWSCVTCRACMDACPVQIEHVPLIVDMRRGLVMESRIDANMTRLLNNLANTGNAYGFPATDRDAWADGLDVPRLADVADPSQLEVLYWVGCSGSYDSRNQKVSRALVKLLRAANVNFAILGKEERCNGDPARRLGEESRFQELALANVETLKKYNVRRVIAQCPHCFNTLQNEYRRFGIELRVEHHTQFLERLAREGRLPRMVPADGAITFHDPCYLGRYNDEYAAPRRLLNLVRITPPTEMPRSHQHSFCCGAGGSNMWFEVKEERERISQIRFREAQATGAKRLATACPFCMTMFDDAARVSGEETMKVQDVAEILADSAAPGR